jgi:hypothetical protein
MANNFTTDPACVALYRFEPGALTADSIGANTLTPTASPPTSDATNFLEGAGAASFAYASSQAFTLPDATLPSGFPLKNGETNRVFTIAGRTRMTYQSGWRSLVCKRYGANKYSFGVTVNGARLNIISGYNSGNSWQIFDTGIDFPLNNFASWIVSVDGVSNSFFVYAYRSDNHTYYFNKGTISNAIWISDAAWAIGGHANLDSEFIGGQNDEVVFFKRAVNLIEATNIINQTFNGSISGIVVGATGVQLISTDAPSIRVGAAGVMVIYQNPAPNPCRSLTTNAPLQIYNAVPSNCRSLTTVGVCPIAPPASCKSLTTAGVAPIPPLASCKSLSRIEAIAAPLANCASLTYCGIIPENRVGNCESRTISQPLLLAVPYLCESKSKCQVIPPFDGGLFLIL